MLKNTDLTCELMQANTTKNKKVLNPDNGTLIFGKIPDNPTGIPSRLIYLRLGYIGNGVARKGAFGARHIWEKHQTDLSIQKPEDVPKTLADILTAGVDILYEDSNKPVVLNTQKGLVSLQLKKDPNGDNEYSIVSAYGRRNSRGVVFAKLEKA